MEWLDIIGLLNQGEGQSLEFERGTPTAEDLSREMVAFANSNGGKLVLGIDDKNKHFVGAKISPNFKDWVADVIREHCSPPIYPHIEILERDNKNVVVITVSDGDEKPYRADDICYIRDGALSRPAKPEEEEEIKTPFSGQDLNRRQKRAIPYLKEHSKITNREYRDLFNVSHKTAHIELTMLVDKGIVESQGSGRSTCYVLIEGALSSQEAEINPTIIKEELGTSDQNNSETDNQYPEPTHEGYRLFE